MPVKTEEENEAMEERQDKEMRLREKRTEFAAMRVKIAKWDVQRPTNFLKKVLEGFIDYWDEEMLRKK